MKPLRDDPRFKQLLKRMNLPEEESHETLLSLLKTRFGQQDGERQRSIQLAGVLDSHTRCDSLCLKQLATIVAMTEAPTLHASVVNSVSAQER